MVLGRSEFDRETFTNKERVETHVHFIYVVVWFYLLYRFLIFYFPYCYCLFSFILFKFILSIWTNIRTLSLRFRFFSFFFIDFNHDIILFIGFFFNFYNTLFRKHYEYSYFWFFLLWLCSTNNIIKLKFIVNLLFPLYLYFYYYYDIIYFILFSI